MKYLKVNLWGKEIGRLVWDSATRLTRFVYNPATINETPDIAPLLSPAETRNSRLSIFGDERPAYQGLPPFIADSLPDSWGNTLFDRWVKDNRVPRNKVTPLYKLMFIGSRGMGALEYEPYADELTHAHSVDIKSLYDISLRILEDRNDLVLTANDQLTLQALLAVGTSAGGRQMKAIIAINSETGEIRSGQTDSLEGFDYYILKFGDKSMPVAEIETAYHHMAMRARINMEECRLIPIEGINHFLTKRFDRKDGKKIHIQTLAAMNPEARSYEDLIATCRQLAIDESATEQLFSRMAFNVLANNTDDHNKNFSFTLAEDGEWRLSPAYDVTFIFNRLGTGPNTERRLSICGKTSEITKDDLLEFGRLNDIKNANAIIDRVAEAVSHFDEYADRFRISRPWRNIIRKTLNDNLIKYGYASAPEEKEVTLHDKTGREITEFTVSVNSKGYYEVTAVIDGRRRRRFVRPNMPAYTVLSHRDIYTLPAADKIALAEALFPAE